MSICNEVSQRTRKGGGVTGIILRHKDKLDLYASKN